MVGKREEMERSLYWNGDFRDCDFYVDPEEAKEAIESVQFWHGKDSVRDYEQEWYGVKEREPDRGLWLQVRVMVSKKDIKLIAGLLSKYEAEYMKEINKEHPHRPTWEPLQYLVLGVEDVIEVLDINRDDIRRVRRGEKL